MRGRKSLLLAGLLGAAMACGSSPSSPGTGQGGDTGDTGGSSGSGGKPASGGGSGAGTGGATSGTGGSSGAGGGGSGGAATGGASGSGGQTPRMDASAGGSDGASTGGPEAGGDTGTTPVPPDMGGAPLGPFPLEAIRAAKSELFAAAATQVEGPSWRDGDVFFAADGGGFGMMRAAADRKLYRYFPTNDLSPIGSYALKDGSILWCDHKLTVVQVFQDGKVAELPHSYQGKNIDFCNDITVDAEGNIYFSNPHSGDVYRITPGGQVDHVIARAANGVEVDPQSKYLYFGAGGTVSRLAIPKSGTAFGAPETVVAAGADGMQFDAWGNLWMAIFSGGEIRVYNPDRKQNVITISAGPGGTTNLTFGGKDSDTLYITNANRGLYKMGPIAGLRGFLHPGADKYMAARMLTITPADQLVK
jgi:sugar lactone lactonase YvrE